MEFGEIMKNKLTDLNNHLFAQLERLNDEDLSGDKLSEEIDRAKAVSQISKDIVSNASLALNAEKFRVEYAHGGIQKMPEMLEQK